MEGLGPVNETVDPQGFWTGRRVLVTGATGMVGSWLCRRLVGVGAQVVALVRDADPQSELLRSGTISRIAVINGCLEQYGDVERAVNEGEVDTVFHLGAQTIVGTARRSPLPTLAANVMGTSHVLEAARVHSSLVERVVVASSDKAYGAQQVLPYTEDTSLTGRDPYEVSKSAGDLIAQAYHATYGLPVGIARCGNIYGGGDLNWSRIVPGSIRALFSGDRLIIRSDGQFLRDYIFVEDVVDAYLALGESITTRGTAGEAFNFSEGTPLSVLALYAAIVKAMDVDYVEPEILDQAGGEIRDQYLDSTKARELLDWKPRYGLEEGLARTVDWYVSLLRG